MSSRDPNDDKYERLKNDLNDVKKFQNNMNKIYQKEFNTYFKDILFLSKEEFFSFINNEVENTLTEMYSDNIFQNEEINEYINNSYKLIEDEYNYHYKILNKAWNEYNESKNKNKLDNKLYLSNYRKHCCESSEFASHNCSVDLTKFYLVNYENEIKYVICINCESTFFSNSILCHCFSCNIDYYTSVLDKNENINLQIATWKKYHCPRVINPKMKCILCSNDIYLNIKTKMLNCQNPKCKFISDPSEIFWKCIVCNKEFKSEAIIYNPLEFIHAKSSLIYTLIIRKKAHPKIVPCCYLNVLNNIFYHKEDCNGILYEGDIDNKVIILCEKCKAINLYERFVWTCPKCKKRFKDGKKFILTKSSRKSIDKYYKNNNYFYYSNSGKKNQKAKTSLFDIIKARKFGLKIKTDIIMDKARNTLREFSKESSHGNNLLSSIERSNSRRKNLTDGEFIFSLKDMNKSRNKFMTLDNELNGSKLNKVKKKIDFEEIESKEREKKEIERKEREKREKEKREKEKKEKEKREREKREIGRKEREEREKREREKKEKEKKEKEKKEREEKEKREKREREKREREKREREEKERKEKEKKEKEEREKREREKREREKREREKREREKREREEKEKKEREEKEKREREKKEREEKEKKEREEKEKREKEEKDKKEKEEKENKKKLLLKTRQNMFDELIVRSSKAVPNVRQLFPIKEENIKENNGTKSRKTITEDDGILSSSSDEYYDSEDNSYHSGNIFNEEYNNGHFVFENKKVNKRIENILSDTKIPLFNIDDYEIESTLGEGSNGIIYKVKNIYNGKIYAMKKILANDIEQIEKAHKEYEIVSICNHPNVMKIYSMNIKTLDITTYCLYILMEIAICDWDKEIKKHLNEGHYYKENELILILKQLVRALYFMQTEVKITHRDIKPQNILCFPKHIYKIADFGEAKAVRLNRGKMNTVKGTQLYMSPALYDGLKQDLDDVSHDPFKSDVFSLGFCFTYAAFLNFNIIYEVREITDMKKLEQVLRKHFKDKYSEKFITILCKMLEIDERKRFDFLSIEKYIEDNYPNDIVF